MAVRNPIPGMTPIRQRAKSLQVYEQVREAIASGQFKPGDTLSTRPFAEALGVSQMPVREAFHRLVAEGALENRSNRTIGLPTVDLRSFEELTEIRLNLEGLATAKAALRISEPDIKRLEALVSEMQSAEARSDRIAYLRSNRLFHFAVYDAGGSRELTKIIDQLWLRVGPVLNWSIDQRGTITRSNLHHTRLVTALAQRDPASAEDALRRDVSETADIVRSELHAAAQ